MRIVFPACVIGLGSVSTWAVASLFLGTSGSHFPQAWPFHGPGGSSPGPALQARGLCRTRQGRDPRSSPRRHDRPPRTSRRNLGPVRGRAPIMGGRDRWGRHMGNRGVERKRLFRRGAQARLPTCLWRVAPNCALQPQARTYGRTQSCSHGASLGGRVTVDGRPAAGVESPRFSRHEWSGRPTFSVRGRREPRQTRLADTVCPACAPGSTCWPRWASYLVRQSRHSPVTTLYPGTISANEARRFDVKEGTVVNDLRIGPEVVPVVRVSGQVVSSTGAPLDAIVSYGRRDQPFLDQSWGPIDHRAAVVSPSRRSPLVGIA